MRRTTRHITTSIVLSGGLLLGACGGSDSSGSAEPTNDLPPDTSMDTAVDTSTDDAATSGLAPDEPVDPDDPAVSGEAPDSAGSGGAYSGGVIAADFEGICDVLDEAKVAELFAIEATSIVSSANTSTGVCEFGDGATVRLLVSRPDLSVGADAPDFYTQTIGFISDDGVDVAEAEVAGITRAAFSERDNATVAFALDPYFVEMRDANAQADALDALIPDVVEALR